MDTKSDFDSLLAAARKRVELGGEDLNELLAERNDTVFRRMPGWLQRLEPYQVKAINEIVQAFAENDVVVLEAPPGAGKTVIAEGVRQILKMRGTYVCTTKSLQEQFLRDFGAYSSVLKGRSNYEIKPEDSADENGRAYPKGFSITAADCTKEYTGDVAECRWCDPVSSCPYERAKAEALAADVAVLNTRYFLTEANGPGRFSSRAFTVVDEADTLENELMGYAEVDVSPRTIRQYGLGEPRFITKESAWVEWVQRARLALRKSGVQRNLLQSTQAEVEEIRAWKQFNMLKANLADLEAGLTSGRWVYTGKSGRVSFKPVTVDSIATAALWKHSRKWLLMSGTILSPKFLLEDCLGLSGNWSYISMGSPFEVKNRLIHFKPLATMNKKSINEGALDGFLQGLAPVLASHRDERVLLHTVSYELTDAVEKFIRDNCSRRTFTYRDSRGREVALEQFKANPGSVLVAPSMDRGIDLPGDLCRVVGVCRVPFPNLGDRQVSARLHSSGGQTWYNVQTIRSIIQMTGRGVRNKDDWCTTYIFDKQFRTLWNKNRWLFPEWWREAVVWR